jgi:phospholipase C
VLATIEAKWNLPAMTYRDANARTVADFLDTSTAALREPPQLASTGSPLAGELRCSAADPKLPILPAQKPTPKPRPKESTTTAGFRRRAPRRRHTA